MDQIETSFEGWINDLKAAILETENRTYSSPEARLDLILDLEYDLWIAEERLYQYRLKKEANDRIQVHSGQEPSV